jgi:hypothetical protein
VKPRIVNPTKKELEQRALERKLAAAAPVVAPTGRPFYDSFDSYVADHPEGEHFRTWVTNRGAERQVALFLGTSVADNALPGHYLWATLTELAGVAGKYDARIQLSLHDNDDGLAIRTWPVSELEQAKALFEQMKTLAPFSMWDAIAAFELRRE